MNASRRSRDRSPRRVLCIAGLDPSGGAGIAADLAAVGALGQHPEALLTMLSAQNAHQVAATRPVAASLLAQQLKLLSRAGAPHAVKIGVLGSAGNAETIAAWLAGNSAPAVWDPVDRASSGPPLNAPGCLEAACEHLLPQVALLTPNAGELARLLEITGAGCAAELLDRGPQAVLVTGGDGSSARVTDTLITAQGERHWRWPRRPGRFRGTGCTLSSAIAAGLAAGAGIEAAVDAAQHYTQQTLAGAYRMAGGIRIPRRIPSV